MILNVLLAAGLVALLAYLLVRNPRNLRKLALGVIIPFGLVMVFVGGLLLLG